MLIHIFVFIFGSIIGSFLNVCIYRLPRGESIITPFSHCPSCDKKINWFDNIPLVSYVVLRARCRFCKAKIPFRYFLVEFLTASAFLGFFILFGLTAKFSIIVLLASLLIIATFVDFERQEIPDEVTIGGLVAGLMLSLLLPDVMGARSRWPSFVNSASGALIGGGSIYLIGFFGEIIFKREAMGGGDVKLLAMIGAFLGWKLTVLTFFIAPFFGAVVGIILKIKEGREIIPYGPYLSLGAIISFLFGNDILNLLFYRA